MIKRVVKIEVKLNVPSIKDMCPMCFGTGKLKAMQMAMTYDAGSIRTKDTTVKCHMCNGTGLKE